jgi:hypothetical protein
MVETISYFSRASDRGVPNYQNLDDGRDLAQVAPGGSRASAGEPSSATDSASQNPATVISFSQTALNLMAAMQSSSSGISTDRFDRAMTSEQADQRAAQLSNSFAGEDALQLDKVKVELSYLNRLEQNRDTYTAALERLQAAHAKMRDTPPKTAVTLNAADTAKALKMLKDAGRTLTIPGSKDGTYGFIQDGIQYNFKGDGTVTAQQEGVATSADAQQEWLARIEDSMSHISSFLTDTSARREALTTERDALIAKLPPAANA